jgi:hypothetical protein
MDQEEQVGKKPSRTVTWSPYVERKVVKYTEELHDFTSISSMVESAMNQLIAKLESEV